MTGPTPRGKQARRPGGGRPGNGGFGTGGFSRSAVGDQLRDAREARGVDVYRVERDTKIRAKYIAALEAGDFAELPGDVYIRGFLRNYSSYLGLDPDQMEDDWRLETGEQAALPTAQDAQPARFAGPRPVMIRRPFRMERRHIAIVAVVVIVAMIGSYFGLQVGRFLEYPTVGVPAASGSSTITVPAGTTSYIIEGTATAGSTVLISWDGQDPSTIRVDDTGRWSWTATLHFGSNQFDITAKNLDTNHTSKVATLIIQVPVVTPTPPAPMVAFETPAEGASVSGGAVTVTGTSVSVSSVSIKWVWLGQPPVAGATVPPVPTDSPAAAPTPSGSPNPSVIATAAPTPATARPAADGSFSFALQLNPGLYQLVMTGTANGGSVLPSVYRTVVVPYKGLNIVMTVKGGPASVYFAGDGKKLGNATLEDGYTATFTLGKWFCVQSARPGLVYLTVNGRDIGTVADFGGRRVYIDTARGPRNIAQCPNV
jgi:cytoskeletal protein RodZ